jgi:hypothetical protein
VTVDGEWVSFVVIPGIPEFGLPADMTPVDVFASLDLGQPQRGNDDDEVNAFIDESLNNITTTTTNPGTRRELQLLQQQQEHYSMTSNNAPRGEWRDRIMQEYEQQQRQPSPQQQRQRRRLQNPDEHEVCLEGWSDEKFAQSCLVVMVV